jgi:hypothetical protein
MRSDEACDRLRTMLREADVDVEWPRASDVDRAWEVMRRFALEPAADVPAEVPGDYDDGLFAQYGVFDWTFTGEREFFELDMTRQLAVPAPGQPILRRVHCTFRFAPTPELRAFGDADLDSFEIGLPWLAGSTCASRHSVAAPIFGRRASRRGRDAGRHARIPCRPWPTWCRSRIFARLRLR